MRHTIWYSDLFNALVKSERFLYEALDQARDDDPGSALSRRLETMHQMLVCEIDQLADEAEADDYPFTELEGVEFHGAGFDRCEVAWCDRKVVRVNLFVAVCQRHTRGRPKFYGTPALKRRGLLKGGA